MKRHRSVANPHAHVEVDRVTFRLFPPYTALIAERAREANLKPSQFARLATMALADADLLQLGERLGRIETELMRLRRDFNEAVDTEEE